MNYAEKTQILRDFEKLICFYSFRSCLDFEDMNSFLTLFLLDLIQRGKCASKRYVAVALRNEFIRISKRFLAIRNTELEFLEFCLCDDEFTCTVENKMLVRDALKTLTNEQKNIIKLRFFYGLNSSEIAKMKGISRQAVNGTEKRAFDKLKALL